MSASTDLVASIKERNTGNAILVTPANEIYTEPVNNGSQVNRVSTTIEIVHRSRYIITPIRMPYPDIPFLLCSR